MSGQKVAVALKYDAPTAPRVPFTTRRRTLDWPVTGTLVQRFGRQRDPKYGTTTLSNGIAIGSPSGTEIDMACRTLPVSTPRRARALLKANVAAAQSARKPPNPIPPCVRLVHGPAGGKLVARRRERNCGPATGTENQPACSASMRRVSPVATSVRVASTAA